MIRKRGVVYSPCKVFIIGLCHFIERMNKISANRGMHELVEFLGAKICIRTNDMFKPITTEFSWMS